MRIRSACARDMKCIIDLFKKHDFKLDTKHLERLIVYVDKKDKILGILMLNTVLECSFITDEALPKKSRILALKALVAQGKKEVKTLHFDLVHAFSNDKIEKILMKHFKFVEGKGKNLIYFVE